MLLTKTSTFIIGPVATLLGYIMNAIFWVQSQIGIESIGLCIILFTIELTIERKEQEMLKTIRLTPEDVKHFVDVASKCDFDIDICYNRYVIDAKSFLGVYGLDFTKPLTVSYDGYNDKFEEMLKQCAIAC